MMEGTIWKSSMMSFIAELSPPGVSILEDDRGGSVRDGLVDRAIDIARHHWRDGAVDLANHNQGLVCLREAAQDRQKHADGQTEHSKQRDRSPKVLPRKSATPSNNHLKQLHCSTLDSSTSIPQ